jgi:hypothetical protein
MVCGVECLGHWEWWGEFVAVYFLAVPIDVDM